MLMKITRMAYAAGFIMGPALFVVATTESPGQPAPTWDVASDYSAAELRLTMADGILVQDIEIDPRNPPRGYHSYPEIGIIAHEAVEVQRLHSMPAPWVFAEAPRTVVAPNGDYVCGFVAGRMHYMIAKYKSNDIFFVRSSDQGKTWTHPKLAWDVDYNQHTFNPLRPSDSDRLYSFALEADFDQYVDRNNGPLGMRHSDDNGLTWSQPEPVRPSNDPDFAGVSHMQPCETDRGTWLLPTYTIVRLESMNGAREDYQYVLRSEDRGKTWELIPGPRPEGWTIPETKRLLEGTILSLGGDQAVMFCRNQLGFIQELRTYDDGKTWSAPQKTPLVHPDAPPMIYRLDGGQTLIGFIHNRSASHRHINNKFNDRRELWITLSENGGRTWSEPRFVIADATELERGRTWDWVEASYGDLLVDGDVLNFTFNHKKQQILNLRFKRDDLDTFPTLAELEQHAANP